MLENNILINVNKLKVGDEIMTNYGATIIEELITNHMREGYYVINNELKITNDHPLFVNNSVWKRTEDLSIGDMIFLDKINQAGFVEKKTKSKTWVNLKNINIRICI